MLPHVTNNNEICVWKVKNCFCFNAVVFTPSACLVIDHVHRLFHLHYLFDPGMAYVSVLQVSALHNNTIFLHMLSSEGG